jgi:hypothetical protein
MGGRKQLSCACTTTKITRCGAVMVSLDPYRTTSEGTEWVGSFLGLDDVAKVKLMELAETAPGDDSIFDQSTGDRLSIKTFLNSNP